MGGATWNVRPARLMANGRLRQPKCFASLLSPAAKTGCAQRRKGSPAATALTCEPLEGYGKQRRQRDRYGFAVGKEVPVECRSAYILFCLASIAHPCAIDPYAVRLLGVDLKMSQPAPTSQVAPCQRTRQDEVQGVVSYTPSQGLLTPGRRQEERHRDVRASEHRQRDRFGFAAGEEEPVECRRACPLEGGIRLRGRV